MSCTIYTMSCNFAIHATCSLELMMYKCNELQMFITKLNYKCLLQNWITSVYYKIELQVFITKLNYKCLLQNWITSVYYKIELQGQLQKHIFFHNVIALALGLRPR
jgi:hypothetical protein